MSSDFDPYYKWLGIVPQDQPPHYYRLLGLAAFEADLQVIEGAAERQLTYLRKFQSGEHGPDCQRLLNEVARARLCLLKPQSKAAYDEQLRRQLEPAVEAEEPPAFAESDVPPPVRRKKSSSRKRAKASLSNNVIIGAVGSAVLLLVILVFAFRGPGKQPVEPAASVTSPAVAPVQPIPAQPIPAQPPAPPVDILPLLKPEHLVRGEWQITDHSLKVTGKTPQAQVVLPITVPAEYTLHVEGTRLVGASDTLSPDAALCLGLVCGQHEVQLMMTGNPGSGVSGLSLLDEHFWRDNETTLPRVGPQPNKPFKIDAIVRQRGIEIRFDGRTIVDWQGDFSRLKRPDEWKLAKPGALSLGAEAPFDFTQITLSAPLPRTAVPGGELKPGESIELLKSVDLARDVWAGQWTRNASALQNEPPQAFSRFSIPYILPPEYELVTEIESADPRFGLYLGLPSGEKRVATIIDGHEGKVSGIFLDDSWDALPDLTRRGQSLPINQRVKITTVVRPNQFVVKVGETVLQDWTGEQRRCQRSVLFATPGNYVTFGNFGVACRLYSMRLTRLTPTATFPVPATPQAGDLLGIAEPQRDATVGSWALEKGRLVSSASQVAALHFPAKLPLNYEVRCIVERKSGNQDLAVSLPVAGKSVMVVIDGERSGGKPQSASGIEWVEGRRFYHNSTSVDLPEPQLPIGRPGVALFRVTGRHFQFEFNGQKVLDLDIPENLPDPTWSMRPSWLNAEERLRLALATYRSSIEFREVRFRPLDGASPPFPPLALPLKP